MKIPDPENYVGSPVCVHFLDHVSGSRSIITARVYGELEEVTNEHILVRAFCTSDKETDDDADIYALVRVAVKDIYLAQFHV